MQRENQPDDLLNERKIYLFGIGTDFRKLKYPFIWYDILHVTDVLSRFPFFKNDPRLQEMVETFVVRQDERGRFTASSVWMAWRGWGFGQKKEPSPWLTLLVLKVIKRLLWIIEPSCVRMYKDLLSEKGYGDYPLSCATWRDEPQ